MGKVVVCTLPKDKVASMDVTYNELKTVVCTLPMGKVVVCTLSMGKVASMDEVSRGSYTICSSLSWFSLKSCELSDTIDIAATCKQTAIDSFRDWTLD
ncbi:hypothetical protein SK128_001291 [Halocaridina rubra]|uniref:Uncharacterized protein n=1 Tax=Halocaridina rubra TaxID=373956 RepID=A0AAN8X2R1_HALRR